MLVGTVKLFIKTFNTFYFFLTFFPVFYFLNTFQMLTSILNIKVYLINNYYVNNNITIKRCDEEQRCTQSPWSEHGPVKIPDDVLKTYKCREYVAQYPSQRRQLKE